MILLLGGTGDARRLAGILAEKGWPVTLSAVTAYGAQLAEEMSGVQVRQGPLTEEELWRLLRDGKFRVVIDATHPFAREIKTLARRLSYEMGIPYLRYARPEEQLPAMKQLYRVNDFSEAAKMACRLGEVIFLTIGSKNLEPFVVRARSHGKRLVVRVLPEEEGIIKCRRLGLLPSEIVAIQGPLSEELNLALFKHFAVQVLVSKESGQEGGVAAKLRAAAQLGLAVVLIARPPEPEDAVRDAAALICRLQEILKGEGLQP